MTTQKTKPTGRDAGADRREAAPPEEIVDRLAGQLPAEELERLEPDQVTGPAGCYGARWVVAA